MHAARAVTAAPVGGDDLDRYLWAVQQLLGDAQFDDETDVEAFFAFVIDCHDRGDPATDCARRWAESRAMQ